MQRLSFFLLLLLATTAMSEADTDLWLDDLWLGDASSRCHEIYDQNCVNKQVFQDTQEPSYDCKVITTEVCPEVEVPSRRI